MNNTLRHIAMSLLADRRSRWAVWVFAVFCFLAVFGDFIANDKPLYCRIEGKVYFPVFRSIPVSLGMARWPEVFSDGDWHNKPYEKVIHTPIPYKASNLDLRNTGFKAPFSSQNVRNGWFRHWLGTDNLGRDVVAGLVRGCRVSLLVGLISMLLAAMIGIPLGAVSGYFGNKRHRTELHRLVIWVIAILLVLFYCTYGVLQLAASGLTFSVLLYLLVAIAIVVMAYALLHLLWKFKIRSRTISVPWDFFILRGIEVLRSIPAFFLLFAILGLVREPSLIYVVLLIAVLRCPSIIRYVRAESLKLRDQTFVDAARVVGLTNIQIVRRHIIPNSLGPVFITMAFGVGGAVLLESGLSFLGIGSGLEEITWGKMLNMARINFSAWWLAVFPGIAIFLMIASFNRIGDTLTEIFQRR